MDAYQGYHPLAASDHDKASFVTSDGTYCDMVIHFGLKNTRATYQQMMNNVFAQQIERNI